MPKIRSGNRLVVCPMIYGGAPFRQAPKSNPPRTKAENIVCCVYASGVIAGEYLV